LHNTHTHTHTAADCPAVPVKACVFKVCHEPLDTIQTTVCLCSFHGQERRVLKTHTHK